MNAMQINQQPSQIPMRKEKTAREKALEFAKKNVPKPARRGAGLATDISVDHDRRSNQQ